MLPLFSSIILDRLNGGILSWVLLIIRGLCCAQLPTRPTQQNAQNLRSGAGRVEIRVGRRKSKSKLREINIYLYHAFTAPETSPRTKSLPSPIYTRAVGRAATIAPAITTFQSTEKDPDRLFSAIVTG